MSELFDHLIIEVFINVLLNNLNLKSKEALLGVFFHGLESMTVKSLKSVAKKFMLSFILMSRSKYREGPVNYSRAILCHTPFRKSYLTGMSYVVSGVSV
jgi:hypothetical protein